MNKPQKTAILTQGPSVHIAGVTGSSPVPPTIKLNHLALWKTVVVCSNEQSGLSRPAFTAGVR